MVAKPAPELFRIQGTYHNKNKQTHNQGGINRPYLELWRDKPALLIRPGLVRPGLCCSNNPRETQATPNPQIRLQRSRVFKYKENVLVQTKLSLVQVTQMTWIGWMAPSCNSVLIIQAP